MRLSSSQCRMPSRPLWGAWMRYNKVSTTEICKQIMWTLIKVIWHEMSERELGFGSLTINSNLLRLVHSWQYSALLQIYNATVMPDEFWQTRLKVKSLQSAMFITPCSMRVFDGTNNTLRILLFLEQCQEWKLKSKHLSWWCLVLEQPLGAQWISYECSSLNFIIIWIKLS